jgi:hypothetical protein
VPCKDVDAIVERVPGPRQVLAEVVVALEREDNDEGQFVNRCSAIQQFER